jgi:hypothetical protein
LKIKDKHSRGKTDNKMVTTDYEERRRRKNVERNFSRRNLQRRILYSHSVENPLPYEL